MRWVEEKWPSASAPQASRVPAYEVICFFASGFSNKVKLVLLKVLILGITVCCGPNPQEGNGDTNSLLILP